MSLHLRIRPQPRLHLSLQPSQPRLRLKISEGHSIDWYEGPYEVTPTRYEQWLHTRDKTMRADVNVHEIPYYETANPYGTTYVIGE